MLTIIKFQESILKSHGACKINTGSVIYINYVQSARKTWSFNKVNVQNLRSAKSSLRERSAKIYNLQKN